MTSRFPALPGYEVPKAVTRAQLFVKLAEAIAGGSMIIVGFIAVWQLLWSTSGELALQTLVGGLSCDELLRCRLEAVPEPSVWSVLRFPLQVLFWVVLGLIPLGILALWARWRAQKLESAACLEHQAAKDRAIAEARSARYTARQVSLVRPGSQWTWVKGHGPRRVETSGCITLELWPWANLAAEATVDTFAWGRLYWTEGHESGMSVFFPEAEYQEGFYGLQGSWLDGNKVVIVSPTNDLGLRLYRTAEEIIAQRITERYAVFDQMSRRPIAG